MRVKMENLTKKFGDFTAVDSFSVILEDGELTALLGPSGCGKTTILNMLAGIVPVTGGRIYFDDELINGIPPEKRGIGLVFQNYALYPHMTVMENICFPLEIQHIPRNERLRRAVEMAELVHVEKYLNRKPKELSGGQQQRVAIARALVEQPRLLLLDEPLSNLDARLRLEMREEIRRIQQQTKVTTVFVTHDQEEAMSISDHIALMSEGKLQQYDQPQILYNEPDNQFVANFLGNPPINNFLGHALNEKFVLEDKTASFKYLGCKALPPGTQVRLSVRAESFVLEEQESPESMSCVVGSVYQMGKEEMAGLSFGSTSFRAYIASEFGLKVGDRVNLAIKRRGVFLFDARSGERYR